MKDVGGSPTNQNVWSPDVIDIHLRLTGSRTLRGYPLIPLTGTLSRTPTALRKGRIVRGFFLVSEFPSSDCRSTQLWTNGED